VSAWESYCFRRPWTIDHRFATPRPAPNRGIAHRLKIARLSAYAQRAKDIVYYLRSERRDGPRVYGIISRGGWQTGYRGKSRWIVK
jgi:hypothetical protein